MSGRTNIEWTDATWNPWHGCHKVSPGCKNCYMFREKRMYGQDPNVVVRSKTKFTDPLKWKDSRRVFTCSWSDWFIEEADAWRDEAWDIIRRTPQHTYQILTKRIERADGRIPIPALPNVWLGVSVENQETADLRIPALLRAAAAVRFVSYEPALGPVEFAPWIGPDYVACSRGVPFPPTYRTACAMRDAWKTAARSQGVNFLHWLIVGGESGPGARPFDLAWARSVIEQCRAAGVPCFVKQLGARPIYQRKVGAYELDLKDRKGGAIEEWPEWARVREFPRSGSNQRESGTAVTKGKARACSTTKKSSGAGLNKEDVDMKS